MFVTMLATPTQCSYDYKKKKRKSVGVSKVCAILAIAHHYRGFVSKYASAQTKVARTVQNPTNREVGLQSFINFVLLS